MQKILVPVDFSNQAYQAFLYARNLAKAVGTALEVIYVDTGHFKTKSAANKLERATELEKKILDFINLDQAPSSTEVLIHQKIETKVIQGDVTHQLVQASKDSKVEMLLMATSGSKQTIGKLFGSISVQVAQQAACPVLLIPQGAKYKDFKSILYASNFESVEEQKLLSMVDFANTFRAVLHFIHVTEDLEEDYSKLENKIFDWLFKDGDPAFAFNMATIQSDSVVKGLNQYMEENEIDLVTVVNRQRSILDNVLGRSITKEMALRTEVPLMVYRE